MFLKISEIFYSLQGEGARAGTPTIFIRLQGCKAKYACFASGVKCDTEFESGKEQSVEDIYEWILKHGNTCKAITWTGGEPTDQLTEEIIMWFKSEGFFQAIETSGINPVPFGLDFVCVSPKVAEHIIKNNFPKGVDELKYIRHIGQDIPKPQIEANHYWVSPHFDGMSLNMDNLRHCVKLCLENPKWKLSIQNHKIWGVL